jgi:hypothetical protein
MSEHERPSLRLAALIDEERARDYGDAERSARIFASVTKTIAAGAAASVAGAGAHGAATAAGHGGAHTAASAAAKGAATWTTSKVIAIVALSSVASAGVGAGAQRVLSPPPSAPTSVAVSMASPPRPVPPAPSDEEPSAPAPVISSPRPRGASAPSASAPRASSGDLEREQALIDVARAGLARGHPDAALDAISRHEASYPHGQLAEERDGLRIVALLRSGRRDEARMRARTFHATYPKSALWPKIERALESEGP